MGTAGGARAPCPGSQAGRGWHRLRCPRGCGGALCPRGRRGSGGSAPRLLESRGPWGKVTPVPRGRGGSTALPSDAARVATGPLPVPVQAACEMMCVFSLLGRMFIFYGNKTSTQFLNFTPTLICSDGLQADILGSVSPTPVTGSRLGFRGGFEEGVFFFNRNRRYF